MGQQRLQHRWRTGHERWLCLAVVLGVALSAQVAGAKECQRETPLPSDVRLIVPGPEVPEDVARFAGVWSGAWGESGGLCPTLVLEEVLQNGYARVILSYGTSATMQIGVPSFRRLTGRIVEGELRVRVPLPTIQPELTYRLSGEALQGSIQSPDGSTGRAIGSPRSSC